MMPSEVFDAIVAAITALVPNEQANKTDVYVYDPGASDESQTKDRRFSLVPVTLPDRHTDIGSCTEEQISFELRVSYSHTGKVDSWHRVLDDAKQLMDAVTAMHTGIAGVTRVLEDASDIQHDRRAIQIIREFTVRYRGD